VKSLLVLALTLAAGTALADDGGSVQRYFQALDLDGDGYVSLAEAAGDPIIVQRFDKADRNRDGKLSAKEFARLPKVKVRMLAKKKEPGAAVGGSAPKKQKPESASGG
jgi:EF hand domain-containing protein